MFAELVARFPHRALLFPILIVDDGELDVQGDLALKDAAPVYVFAVLTRDVAIVVVAAQVDALWAQKFLLVDLDD